MLHKTKSNEQTKIVQCTLVQCTIAQYDPIIFKILFSMDSPAHYTSVQFINKI